MRNPPGRDVKVGCDSGNGCRCLIRDRAGRFVKKVKERNRVERIFAAEGGAYSGAKDGREL